MKSKAYSRLGTVADNVQWFAMAACYELEIWEKAYPGLGTLANNVGFSAARRLKASWPSGSVYSRPEAAATKGGLVNFFPTMTSTTVTRLLTKVVKPGTRRWAGLLWKNVSWLKSWNWGYIVLKASCVGLGSAATFVRSNFTIFTSWDLRDKI